MTAFKTIKGVPVKTISGNRAGASFEGQLYYDSDGVGIFKFVGALGAGTWASGGSMNTAREGTAGVGTQTAALNSTGYASTGIVGVNESYDGSSWTELGDVNTARSFGSASGTQGVSLYATGATAGSNNNRVTNVETWDGSSWTEIADVNTAKYYSGTTGSTSNF